MYRSLVLRIADKSLLLRVAVVTGVLAFLGVAQGCEPGEECFSVSIVTNDQTEWTAEARAFCEARGFPSAHTYGGFGTRIEEIRCYTGGIFGV